MRFLYSTYHLFSHSVVLIMQQQPLLSCMVFKALLVPDVLGRQPTASSSNTVCKNKTSRCISSRTWISVATLIRLALVNWMAVCPRKSTDVIYTDLLPSLLCIVQVNGPCLAPELRSAIIAFALVRRTDSTTSCFVIDESTPLMISK